MNIEHLAIGELTPYARNSRTHSEAQIIKLVGSLREYGFTNPVLIDAAGGIIAGHGRVMAAQRLGLERVPCIRLAHLTDAQKRAYVIADNKLAEGSGWDTALLSAEIADLLNDGIGAESLAFDTAEIDSLLAGLGDLPGDAPTAVSPAPTSGTPAPAADEPMAAAPLIIYLTQAEMAKWRRKKRAAGIDDNAAAFRHFAGLTIDRAKGAGSDEK